MFDTRMPRSASVSGALAFAFAAALLLVPAIGRADDRDLLRESAGRPMLFVLLDTSDSMLRAPVCSQEAFDAGHCAFLCPEGDCFVPRQADDPGSRLFQARAALYEVLREVDDLSLGWATGNQDRLAIGGKHWLYAATAPGPRIPGFGPYPGEGQEEVFGRQWPCDSDTGVSGAGDGAVGCGAATPADLDDPWESTRVRRLPKGGADMRQRQEVFVRTGGVTYRIVYQPATRVAPGEATIAVAVSIHACGAGGCDNLLATEIVRFALRGAFLSWDDGVRRQAPGMGFFPPQQAADVTADNTCAGWDPNSDTRADAANGIDLRFPTVADPDPTLRPYLDRGDVLPWDWRRDNREEVLARLAPNLLLGESEPDFGVARYLRDAPAPGAEGLDYREAGARPPIPAGSNSLAGLVDDFRRWYGDWEALARAGDPDFGCRPKYLLLVTGGEDDCDDGGNVCSLVDTLQRVHGIRTFVVGFGNRQRPGSDDPLRCIAANGGTGEPILPSHGDDLAAELLSVVGEIREESASFATATAPAPATTEDRTTFLTSFTPLNDAAYWPGRIDAFAGTVPQTDAGEPDTTQACGNGRVRDCHLWNAGEALLRQVDDSDFVGSGPNQRRVFYSRLSAAGSWPHHRRVFSSPPTTTGAAAEAVRYDLWRGLGLVDAATPDGGADDEAALKARGDEILRRSLERKTASVAEGDGVAGTFDYVLAGNSHSKPLLVGAPSSGRLVARDAGFGQDEPCTSDANRGYRCFVERHQRRRNVLFVGSDDGMLHAFDAGIYRQSGTDPATGRNLSAEFDSGRGHELWAYVPRPMLPTVAHLAASSRQLYGVDGSPVAADAFLDPLFDPARGPVAAERQWRTVLIGGFREAGTDLERRGLTGGRGYYALDITQPDRLDADRVPRPAAGGWMPTCLGSPVESNARPGDSQPDGGCGPVPYPAPLWEFTDSALVPLATDDDQGGGRRWLPLDEDGNGIGDLGDTWSTPGVGRILICGTGGGNCDARHVDNQNPYDPDSPGGLEVRTVAVFGGGMVTASKSDPLAAEKGNWIYMVDVETGEAIYKRMVLGAVPAPPAVVDSDGDGYLDLIYVGTTAGLLYRIDLTATGGDSPQPGLESVSVTDVEGGTHQVERVTDSAWRPHILFDTEGRPIYQRPSVLFVAPLARHAVAFGTGDRENLRRSEGSENRFYIFVDDFDIAPGSDAEPTPITESRLTRVEATEGIDSRDLLLDPGSQFRRGWVLPLAAGERLVSDPLAVSGVTTFSTFTPTTGSGEQACSARGESQIYAVNTATSSGVLESFAGGISRSIVVDGLVSDAYTETSPAVETDDDEGGGEGDGDGGGQAPGELDERMTRIMETLKTLMPQNCTFANYRIDIKAVAADTRLQHIAPMPVCIIEKNWKEF